MFVFVDVFRTWLKTQILSCFHPKDIRDVCLQCESSEFLRITNQSIGPVPGIVMAVNYMPFKHYLRLAYCLYGQFMQKALKMRLRGSGSSMGACKTDYLPFRSEISF